ncbi:MAG: adenylate/guanylate cyclase protein [Nevskia sp.]|nr:adenylate/guanylate cyclase protein [Nevskia sp.]
MKLARAVRASRRIWVRLAISAGLFAVFVLQIAGVWGYTLLDKLEDASYDARLRLTLPQTVDPRIVIVDLDERSLAAEGWPWPRAKMATLTQQLFGTYRIRVLGFDEVFSEPDSAAGADLLDRLAHGELADLPGFAARAGRLRAQLDGDQAFARAILGRPVVLGTFFKAQVPAREAADSGAICSPAIDPETRRSYQVDFIQAQGYAGNRPPLQAATPYCGFFDNIEGLDRDGIYRRITLVQEFGGQIYPSLAVAVTAVALGAPAIRLEFDPSDAHSSLNLERLRIGTLAVPVDGRVAAYVPYRGRQRSFPYVSATDVLHGRADAKVLQGAIVLVGTSAAGLVDLRTTPVAKIFPGVEVHANLISGMLDGRIQQKPQYYSGVAFMLLLLIALLMTFLYPRLSPLQGAALVALLVGGIGALALVLWSNSHFIMPLGIPLVFVFALFLAQLLYGYFIEERYSRKISRQFGQYIPPELVSELAASGAEVPMTGENREMTVLFSDIRGFTTISEQFRERPQELTALMNEFLGPLTEVIFRHRGTIDKYMGDAIMAFWGAPLNNPRHAIDALQAAMEFPVALRKLDDAFIARGWPPLRIGVGLNTGTMTVGNMGSPFRVAYTVLGDAVNLGSRIEGLTKEYGVTVMCSESTRAGAPDWVFRELDLVRVKGKNEPVAIYQPLGPQDRIDPALQGDLARHHQALLAYRARRWDEAEREFSSLSAGERPQPVYGLYLQRIVELRSHPPDAGWDGVTTFKTK